MTLYGVEKEVRAQPPGQQVISKQHSSKPVFNVLETSLQYRVTRICGKSTDIAHMLNEIPKLSRVDPQACLTNTLAPIADHKINRIDDSLLWYYVQT